MGKFTGNFDQMYYLYLHSVCGVFFLHHMSQYDQCHQLRALSVSLAPHLIPLPLPQTYVAVTCALFWALSLLLIILIYTLCNLLFDKKYDLCLIMHFTTAAWGIFLFMVLSGSSLALLIKILCGSRRLLLCM